MAGPMELGVPSKPEDAQRLLYYLLGQAVARCQIAEAAARTGHQIFLGTLSRRQQTLGQVVRSMEVELPPELMTEYRRLVDARNYLVHELLSDHGGWTGIPGWDSPELYRKLYASISAATTTIEAVTDRLNAYIAAIHPEVAIFRINGDSVEPIA